MKYLIITILGLGILTGCTYRPKEKRLTRFNNEDGQILESFYKKTSDTIEFKRILSNRTTLKIQSGQIFLGDHALTHQKFTSVQQLANSDNICDSLRTLFKTNGFTEKILDHRDVMFVQIVPDTAMDNLDALGFLNLRQDIEGKIDERLQSKNLGEWFAGDMGAGGNMLFFVDDWNKSMEIVMEILKEEELLDHVLITKRIMTTNEDWSYEVVYPPEYQGVFNQM
jgi:hypothetical protein